MPNIRNKQLYNQLVEEINSSHSLFLFDFNGISANEITKLRNLIKQKNAKIVVVKNTLLNKALKASNYNITADQNTLTKSTAVLFAGSDPVEAIKLLVKYSQDTTKAELKTGYFESQNLSTQKIINISKLPNKLTLQAQFVSMLANPLQRMVNVSNANLQKLAIVIEEIRKTKQN